jgi:hypothetical protein
MFDLIGIAVVIIFTIIVYLKMSKKTLSDVWNDLMDFVEPVETEIERVGL